MITPVVVPASVEVWTRLHAGDEGYLAQVRLASGAELEQALGILRARQAAGGGQYMRYAVVRAEQKRRETHGARATGA